MTNHIEEWRPIPGFIGLYQVSSIARIKALPRILAHAFGGTRLFPEKILKTHLMKNGYHMISLTGFDHKTRGYLVHRLVCSAFHGSPNLCEQANHKDGDKSNNRPENLEWLTPKQNQAHSRDVLGNMRGEKAGGAKLTAQAVLDIRSAHAAGGTTYRDLAKSYAVNRFTVGLIIRRQTWCHI